MKTLRSAHGVLGGLALLAFVLSGQFMHWFLHHLHGMAWAPRLLYRSAHLYLLWAALLNVLLALHWTPALAGWRQRLQRLGSALILLSPILLAVSFVQDASQQDWLRPWGRWGIYSAFLGVMFQVLAAWPRRIRAPAA